MDCGSKGVAAHDISMKQDGLLVDRSAPGTAGGTSTRSVFMAEDLAQSVRADRVLETSRCFLRHPESRDAVRALNAFTSRSIPRDVPLGQLRSAPEVRAWIAGA
jgi:hypothetical protein